MVSTQTVCRKPLIGLDVTRRRPLWDKLLNKNKPVSGAIMGASDLPDMFKDTERTSCLLTVFFLADYTASESI